MIVACDSFQMPSELSLVASDSDEWNGEWDLMESLSSRDGDGGAVAILSSLVSASSSSSKPFSSSCSSMLVGSSKLTDRFLNDSFRRFASAGDGAPINMPSSLMGVSLNCKFASLCGSTMGDFRSSSLAEMTLVGGWAVGLVFFRSTRISPSESVFWSFFFLTALGDGTGETRGLKSMKISCSSLSSFSLSDSQVEQLSSDEDLVSSCMSSGWMLGGVMGHEGGGSDGCEKMGGWGLTSG